ncbi:MAG: histone family protein [Candidatus Nanoarchaeia archaeon]
MAGRSRQTSVIPKAPVARILQGAGAKRVSAGAVDAFADVIQEIAEDIGTQSVRIAKHSGRKTVQEGDVKLAAKS